MITGSGVGAGDLPPSKYFSGKINQIWANLVGLGRNFGKN